LLVELVVERVETVAAAAVAQVVYFTLLLKCYPLQITT
jgi:hypothetical protein